MADTPAGSGRNPNALSVADAARLLAGVSGEPVTEAMIRADLGDGAAPTPMGSEDFNREKDVPDGRRVAAFPGCRLIRQESGNREFERLEACGIEAEDWGKKLFFLSVA